MRDDIDQLAGYFFDNGQFESLFIKGLVPWNELTGESNAGHAAVADMLLSSAAVAALSANFDTLIEQWSARHKVFLQGALDGGEAVDFARESKPLLKFHGCMTRAQEMTLWTHRQLTIQAIAERVASCKAWMDLNLRGRDLLIVGFWTDWGYLNDVLAGALEGAAATASITVVDLYLRADLERKAPGLWATLSASPRFEHVQSSGDEVLKEVRVAFSKVWTRKLHALGRPLFVAEKGNCADVLLEAPDLDVDALYDLRRDAEGVSSNHAARSREPGQSAAQTGYAHLLLAARARARIGAMYELDGVIFRVVHGAGEGLSTVQNRFVEPPTELKPDIVVCAGALNQGVPGNIIGRGQGANVVRPQPGGSSRWMTLDEAITEFAL
jgi:hypothetical protein